MSLRFRIFSQAALAAIAVFAAAPLAHGSSIFTYSLSITMNTGPLTGTTGTGTISYDSSLAATGGGYTWVDPTHGLLEFDITFLSQTFTMANSVGYNTTPVVDLIAGDLSMNNPFGAWGSTTTTPAPDYFINAINGQPAGFTYDSSAYSWSETGSGILGAGFYHTLSDGNQQSTGIVTWTLDPTAVPEPSTAFPVALTLVVLGWAGQRQIRRRT